ncbi:MAG: hypothetical protein ABJB47_07415 [Actinomycetota bacterium]
MSGQPEDALEVLREVWSAQGQTSMRPDDDGTTKACKKMAAVGFDGLASEADGDLRAAWRARLEREGKLSTSGGSIADLVRGPAEARRS